MTAEHRKTIRTAIADGLATACTTAEAVSPFQDPEIAVSPMIRVISGGAMRPPVISRGQRSIFRIIVQVWVLHTKVEGGWTAEDAEDALDQIEYEIAQWVSANQNVPTYWTSLRYAEMSTTRAAEVMGETWLIEDIPLTVEAHI